MFSLCETPSLLPFRNRGTSLLIAVTLVLFLHATAFTWTKKPPDPVLGILSKNVTLEWNFTLSSTEVLDYFVLQKLKVKGYGFTKMVKYAKDGIVFYDSFNQSVVILQNGTTSFMLLNLKNEDKGTYCCEVNTKLLASGKNGKSGTECTQLTILVFPSITTISLNQTVNETGGVTLSCQAKGRPLPTITWLKADDEEKNLSSSSELSFKNVNRDQDGLYLCVANNTAGKAVASVALTVHYAPSINSSTKRYNTTEGNDLDLSCISDGKPPPLVTWTKVGDITNASNPAGQWLTIKKAKRTDAGTYRCTATNGVGKPTVATRHVIVFYPPSILNSPNNHTVNETQELRLVCDAIGNPQPKITWTKGPTSSLLKASNGVLVVKNVTKAYSGQYQCNANNGIGEEAISTFSVTVNYKPRATKLTSNLPENTVTQGQSVTFHCSADGVPSPMYELRFENISLGYSGEGVFLIQKVNFSHQGKYECASKNILGDGKMATISLNVLAPPMTDATTKLSAFTTTMAKTKSSDGPQPTDEVDSKENGEEEPKDNGKVAQQKGKSSFNSYAVLGGVIGSTGLLVIIVSIAILRRKHLQANLSNRANQSSQANEETAGHDNDALEEMPVPDGEENQV